MIESSIINALVNDIEFINLVAKYRDLPAIFSEFAPEDVPLPFAVVSVSRSGEEFSGVHSFNIFVDYFDYDVSRKKSREAAERIEFVLDNATLTHDRYDNIRIRFFAGSPVPESDPRDVHYNLQFNARAGRKKWMSQLVT